VDADPPARFVRVDRDPAPTVFAGHDVIRQRAPSRAMLAAPLAAIAVVRTTPSASKRDRLVG